VHKGPKWNESERESVVYKSVYRKSQQSAVNFTEHSKLQRSIRKDKEGTEERKRIQEKTGKYREMQESSRESWKVEKSAGIFNRAQEIANHQKKVQH
jgi:hypothetical protein